MKKDQNRRMNKKCIDCGTPVTDRATRCKKCGAIFRQSKAHPPIIVTCAHCGVDFRIRPEEKGRQYCSIECRRLHELPFCAACGKQLSVRPKKKVKNPACSRKCRGELHRNRIQLTCLQCGKKLERAPSLVRDPDRSFCSTECKKEWWRGPNHVGYNSLDLVCEICGTSFRRTNARVVKYGGKYCSRACWAQAQVIPGTDSYRGPNWNAQKRKTRNRDGYACRVCGKNEADYGKALDVHHIIPFRIFGPMRYKEANKLSNLISLCKSCHMFTEKGSLDITLYL